MTESNPVTWFNQSQPRAQSPTSTDSNETMSNTRMRWSQATARGGPGGGGKSTGQTPSAKLRREKDFVNDAVAVNNRRTRYGDIIPKYDASKDRYLKKYFESHDVSNATSKSKLVSAGMGVWVGADG